MNRVVAILTCVLFVAANASAAELFFQRLGKPVALSKTESIRVISEIEALADSAAYNSLEHQEEWWHGFVEWTPLDDLKKGSFLHVRYPEPTSFKSVGQPITDIWVEIRETNPHGGLLPGPLTVVVGGRPVHLMKENGTLEIKLGLDPALYPNLPEQMQRDLDRSREAHRGESNDPTRRHIG